MSCMRCVAARTLIQAAPSKQERLEKATQQMRDYAKTAEFHTSEVQL